MPDPNLIRNETGPQRTIGYVLDVGQTDKRARCWLDLTPDHMNRHGVLHGGIAATLLDSASGATGSLTVDPAGRAPFLTISLNTQFVAPVSAGRVTATGTITGGGRSILFISAQLMDDQDRLIASSTGVFKRVPLQPKEGR
ncbi:hotdog fold thioesterase [Parasulfitobacter algicola]|uniref:PaaI family thioesterase n=1 Tax=Parasulfitobacter algicola TaxID=2614809 RepID=A0ABX2IVE3_9RHOB|nr:PaaI family thioesterase [Sulfitobacter algicola]